MTLHDMPQPAAAAAMPERRPAALAETDPDGGPILRPLITAAEMFPALEGLILGATEEILLAFRVFDARTGLRSDAALALGLKTWADLLAHKAAEGVPIRLLMSDFDPVFTADLHRDAWDSAGRFARRMTDAPNAEIVCALHDCAPSPLWHWAFWLPTRARLRSLRDRQDDRLTAPQRRALSGDYCLRPVTLHQKFAVIDRRRAIIGGIDVDERRWDDPDHDRRPEETWHDVSMEVSGPVVSAIRSHFSDCWDRARSTGGTTFSETTTPLSGPEVTASAPGQPDLLRTLSTNAGGPLHFGPVTLAKEHEIAHLDAFAEARDSIYIETQFFRHLPLARALAARAEKVPELQLILVIPTEPERVIFGRDNGMTARHEQALQLRCLSVLRRAFGDRMAVVSPAQPAPAPEGTPMPVKGSGIIYLHSKVTLVDESTGIVGSANLNGRSMLWDTEASVRFHDPAAIRDLREKLGRNWLRDLPGPLDRAATWTEAARTAADQAPEDRVPLILPFPEGRNRRFARYIPILPAAMF